MKSTKLNYGSTTGNSGYRKALRLRKQFAEQIALAPITECAACSCPSLIETTHNYICKNCGLTHPKNAR